MTDPGASSASNTPLPMLRLDGGALSPEQRLAAFAQLASGYSVQPAADQEFQVDARAWQLGNLLFHTTRLSAVRVERSPAHIRADGRDTYSFVLLKRGSWISDADTGFLQVASGQLCVVDFAQSWVNEGAAQENMILVVPRSLVAQIAPNAPSLHGRMMIGASGRLLAEHMLSLSRHLPAMTMADMPAVERATVSLLSAALGALPQEDAKRFSRQDRGLESRVLAYVELGLTNPDLSVAGICRDVGVSRATLYRAFRSTGGIAAYIRQRRLEAAHARIADATEKGRIAEFADLYCFSSPAHFSTAFRRHFGYTPVNARTGATAAPDVQTVFEDWRRILEKPGGAV